MNTPTRHTTAGYFLFFSVIFLIAIAVSVITSFYWLAAIPFLVLAFYLSWQHLQIVFLLLVASLPWSAEFSFTTSLGTDLPDEPLMLLTSLLLIALVSFRPGQASKNWKHPLVLILCLSLIWTGITIPFSSDWIVSSKFLLAKTWYLLAFVFTPLAIFKDKKTIAATGVILVVSIVSIVAISICRHAQFDYRFANINDAVSPFFRNHVNYSAMLVCSVPLLIATYQLNPKLRRLVIAGLVLILTGLFLSYARGAWLALAVGLISYWLIRKRRLLISFVVSLVLLFTFLAWLSSNDRYLRYAHDFRTTIFHQNFEEHLIATYKLKDVSTAERFNRWIAGARMTREHLLLGYGPNTFYDNYKSYTIPAFRTWVSDNRDHSTVHNYFLLVLIEQGIPGALLFLLLIGSMMFYIERLYLRMQDKFYKAVILACGVILTMIIVVNSLSDLIESDKVGSLFFLCLATIVAVDFNTRKSDKAVTGERA